MSKWWTALVLLCVCVVGTAHAQNSNGELLETVWDYQNPEHREALHSFAHARAGTLEERGEWDHISRAEVGAYRILMSKARPHFEVGTELEWKIQFHILADLSELSPAYFGGPLKIKNRVERENSEGLFSNIFKRIWNHTFPKDREDLANLISLQNLEERRQVSEKLRQEGEVIKRSDAEYLNYPLALKGAAVGVTGSILQAEIKGYKKRFHGEDEAWRLFFAAVGSISYWTKEFYGESIFGTDIILSQAAS